MNIFEYMYKDFKFDINKPIRLFEAFSGYGSQAIALKRLGVNVEHVGIAEIDKYAINSYHELHGEVKNYGAIGSFDKLPPDIDICTWSFPCQDISLAGNQKGMVDGSRSNYGFTFLETVENMAYADRPNILLMENVRALFSEKFRDDWREIQLRLENMGYMNYADILNAKDYGVAQNRERVFIVSIKGDYNYNFPKPIKLDKRLKDYLEDEVDEKYYLKDEVIQNTFLNYKGNFNRKKIFLNNVNKKDISQTITTKMDRAESQYVTEPFEILVKTNNQDNLVYKTKEDDMPRHRIYDIKSVGFTITTNESQQPNITDGVKIRKLTPKECGRFMGLHDDEIDKILAVNSNTQSYKQFGNSIVVDVLEAIFKQLV
jgi:DNA (cytosine-5)-methyltransferase 1